jgi:predicted metal-binding protein
MSNPETKEYIVIAQCHIVKERCSGYFCETSFKDRTGGFSIYPKDKDLRVIYLTCGGCCGRALHRKITHLLRMLKKKEGIEKEKVAVQLSSCITKDNFHAPPCPHLDYIKELLNKIGIDFYEDTRISDCSEKRRPSGTWIK